MSDKSIARRTVVKIIFDGTDISKDLERYLLSVSYTDNDEDTGDDLQIKLQDRDGIWREKWLANAIWESGKGMTIQAVFGRQNWKSDGADDILECGTFELDSVTAQGPPNTITIKGTAVPYNGAIQQTEFSKSWEHYDLKKIAGEIASKGDMGLMYLPSKNPSYDRVEQYRSSNITFLKKLCQDAGLSLKVSNMILVIFDQAEYETRDPIREIQYGQSGGYSKYKLNTKETETYALCRVYYNNDGTMIEATQKAENYDPKNNSNQKLEINQKVNTVEEAKALAKEMLRLYNKYGFEGTFTFPGDTSLMAGATVALKGFGCFDGNYLIKQSVHSVSGSGGYTTQIKIQKALSGLDNGSGISDDLGSSGAMTEEQVNALALEVIRGDWSAGDERKQKLTEAGYDYWKVQSKVNDIIYGTDGSGRS